MCESDRPRSVNSFEIVTGEPSTPTTDNRQRFSKASIVCGAAPAHRNDRESPDRTARPRRPVLVHFRKRVRLRAERSSESQDELNIGNTLENYDKNVEYFCSEVQVTEKQSGQPVPAAPARSVNYSQYANHARWKQTVPDDGSSLTKQSCARGVDSTCPRPSVFGNSDAKTEHAAEFEDAGSAGRVLSRRSQRLIAVI